MEIGRSVTRSPVAGRQRTTGLSVDRRRVTGGQSVDGWTTGGPEAGQTTGR